MTRSELAAAILGSEIFTSWHWFRYHFSHELYGVGHPLAGGFMDAALECEARMPGYANEVVRRIASLGGREKHLPDWEQLLTILAELYVVAQIARWPWPAGTSFESEPTAQGSRKNPEIAVRLNGSTYAYEVKTPCLFSHQEARRTNPIQIASRYVDAAVLPRIVGGTQLYTPPRDNPIKDFLKSAEEKFRPFASSITSFTGILVICWDDFVYEPISALEHPQCGLLTDNSYFTGNDGIPVTFPSVGGVVVVRHLHQLFRACRDEPVGDGLRGPFDYGYPENFPWKSFHQNPIAPPVPNAAIECLHARSPALEMGTEYFPKEYVMWLG
ncbi:MAG: hypothetical protein IPK27_07800 [Rhodanobacteraceae bacterium]|nr:hypothetical protein [Rhodanobacteraceae bacterium]